MCRRLAVCLASVLALGAAVESDDLMQGLLDDASCEAQESCAVEFRQLRAQQHLAGTEDQRGALLQATWGDNSAQLQVNQSEGCNIQTGSTCSMFACKESRGATLCVDDLCQCAPGFCAKDGVCFPASPEQCGLDTGVLCSSSTGCPALLGSTVCMQGKCLCENGNCAWDGRCLVLTDTGGTCGYFHCDNSRGKTTCDKGRCLCQSGYVAVQGRCVQR